MLAAADAQPLAPRMDEKKDKKLFIELRSIKRKEIGIKVISALPKMTGLVISVGPCACPALLSGVIVY